MQLRPQILISCQPYWHMRFRTKFLPMIPPSRSVFHQASLLRVTVFDTTWQMLRLRQQCQDANTVFWANQVASTIRSYDSGALVSASVFTFAAVGKPGGPNGLLPTYPACGNSCAYPARPVTLSLYATGLSFIDIHLYPAGTNNDCGTGNYSIDSDLASSEFSLIDQTKSPLMMGEYGAADSYFHTVTCAALGMGNHREQAYARGFFGSSFWTWDLPRDDNPNDPNYMPYYPLNESGGAINGILAPIERITASNTISTAYPYLATDGNAATQWNSGAYAPQWIEIDLGKNVTISKVTLTVAQYPAGHTTHRISGGLNKGSLSLLGTLDGITQSSQVLHLTFNPQYLRYLRVDTAVSPSWIAWSEIMVQ